MLVKRMFKHLREVGLFNLVSPEIKSCPVVRALEPRFRKLKQRGEVEQMKRFGMVIKLKPGSAAAYREYHAAVWPEVLKMIRECNISNYSIYFKDDVLFGYYEYHGSDIKTDLAKMAAHPKTQEWWSDNGAAAGTRGNAESGRMVGGDGRGVSFGLKGE